LLDESTGITTEKYLWCTIIYYSLKQKQIINSFLDLCELEAMNADSILMTHDMRGVTKKKELSISVHQ
jgi:hypothetical protein